MCHAPCWLLAGARTRPGLTYARMLQHCFSTHQVVWQVLTPPRLLPRSPLRIPLSHFAAPTRHEVVRAQACRVSLVVAAGQAGGRRQSAGMVVVAVEAKRDWMVCRSESAQSRPSPSRTRRSRSRLPRSVCARASHCLPQDASCVSSLLSAQGMRVREEWARACAILTVGGGRADTD